MCSNTKVILVALDFTGDLISITYILNCIQSVEWVVLWKVNGEATRWLAILESWFEREFVKTLWTPSPYTSVMSLYVLLV